MPAAGDEIAEAIEEGIQICNSWGPKEILTENGRVTGVVFKKCVSVFDENGRFHPSYDEEQLLTVECESVLIAIGQSVRWLSLIHICCWQEWRNAFFKAMRRSISFRRCRLPGRTDG